MKKKQLKKVTKRVMEEILTQEQHDEIFELLSTLDAKICADNDEDFVVNDISELVQQQCSRKEIQQIRDCIVEAVKKELKKEHSADPDVRKEHSFYVTTRLMITLWILCANLEHKFSEMNNKEKFCYKCINSSRWDLDLCADREELLNLVSYLDS